MNRIILSAILFLSSYSLSIAQRQLTEKEMAKAEKKAKRKEEINNLIKKEEEGALIFQKQNIYSIKLYNDGYSFSFEKGILKTATKTNLYSIELGEHKHLKEEKVLGQQSGFLSGNSFIYGKENNFYFLKLGIAQSLLIGGKGNRNGVATSAIYGGGLSVGLLKPYYLTVTNTRVNQNQDIKYNNDKSYTDTLFLDPNSIVSSTGFFKGLNEIKVKPGVYAKAGLRFDYGRYNEVVSALQVGLSGEYYFSKIPQLLFNKQKKLFINVYVAIEFGKRK